MESDDNANRFVGPRTTMAGQDDGILRIRLPPPPELLLCADASSSPLLSDSMMRVVCYFIRGEISDSRCDEKRYINIHVILISLLELNNILYIIRISSVFVFVSGR